MDPNETLKACRRLAAALLRESDKEDANRVNLGAELAQNFDNLDNWIKRGGFLPDTWRRD